MDNDDMQDPSGGDDLEQMLRKLLTGIVSRAAGHTESEPDFIATEVKPSEEQFEIGPGDLVSITAADSSEDGNLVIGEILDPAKHAGEFPDWEDRLLKSYVLARWYALGQTSGELGWFTRAKLMRFSREEWTIMMDWLIHPEADVEPRPPTWLVRRYMRSLQGISKANPVIPYSINCPKCESTAILLKANKSHTRLYGVGRLPESDDPTALHSLTMFSEGMDTTFELICDECDYTCVLPEDAGLHLR